MIDLIYRKIFEKMNLKIRNYTPDMYNSNKEGIYA